MSDKRRRNYNKFKNTKGPVIRFRFRVVLVVFLFISSVCFVLYMMSANIGGSNEGSYVATWEEKKKAVTTAKPKTTTIPEATVEITSEPEETDDDTDSSKTDDDEDVIVNPVPDSPPQPEKYLDDCVFVGDSITEGLSVYQIISPRRVFAEKGMNTDKILYTEIQTPFGDTTILNAVTQAQPKNLYIMLGSNGIAWITPDNFANGYSDFIDSVMTNVPDTDIYIISIPPVTKEKERTDEKITNKIIDSCNKKLLELANKKKCYYLDLNSHLKGADGAFPEGDAASDGMHFNKSTYDKMIAYILSHVVNKN